MEKIILKAKPRDLSGKKVKQLRSSGYLPIVLYGQGDKAENLLVNTRDFILVNKKAGGSTLVDMQIDDKSPIKVLIKDVQIHPVSDEPLHVDLYKIKMDEEITTEIPLKFIGESPAVKELEGNLITNKDEIEVECLPANLISEIEVDISVLKTFDDVIQVKDLKAPETIKIQDNPEDNVVMVTPPRSEEELTAMEEEAAADQEKAHIEKLDAEAEAEKGEKEESEKSDKDESDKKTDKGDKEGEKKEESS